MPAQHLSRARVTHTTPHNGRTYHVFQTGDVFAFQEGDPATYVGDMTEVAGGLLYQDPTEGHRRLVLASEDQLAIQKAFDEVSIPQTGDAATICHPNDRVAARVFAVVGKPGSRPRSVLVEKVDRNGQPMGLPREFTWRAVGEYRAKGAQSPCLVLGVAENYRPQEA